MSGLGCIRIALVLTAFLLQASRDARAQTADSSSAPGADKRVPDIRNGCVVLNRDTLLYIERNHAGDALRVLPSVFYAETGGMGQPLLLGVHGTTPFQGALLLDGLPLADLVTGQSDPYLLPVDEAGSIIIHPPHKAFMKAGSGMLFAAELIEDDGSAPRPFTRVRHTEGPYDYLFTDVLFTVDTRESDNLRFGLTRRTAGSSGSSNAARFQYQWAESWDARLRYILEAADGFRLSISNRYNDQLVFMNGGVAGIPGAGGEASWDYPEEGGSAFSENAFNPIQAALMAPSIRTQSVRNETRARISGDWSGDSSIVSEFTIDHVIRVRDVSDRVHMSAPDSSAYPALKRKDAWNSTTASLRHRMPVLGSELEISGAAGRYSVAGPALYTDAEAFTGSLSATLAVPFRGFRASVYGRLDRQGSSTGFGAGGDIAYRGGNWNIWAGAARTGRGLSLAERALSGTTVQIGAQELTSMIDAGAGGGFPGFECDIRGHYRRTSSPITLYHAIDPAPAPSPYARIRTVPLAQAGLSEVFGISASALLTLWRLTLEERVAAYSASVGGASPEPAAPGFENTVQLYYRGSIIEGTLRLKIGAGISRRGSYAPLTWDPAEGMFAYASASSSVANFARGYTDAWIAELFLFATIKDDATVHLVLHNALNARYISTQFYPMPEREFRFGVDWIFLD